MKTDLLWLLAGLYCLLMKNVAQVGKDIAYLGESYETRVQVEEMGAHERYAAVILRVWGERKMKQEEWSFPCSHAPFCRLMLAGRNALKDDVESWEFNRLKYISYLAGVAPADVITFDFASRKMHYS